MTRIDLSQGDVSQHLRRLAIPMMWGILSIMSMNIADTFYVGQLGATELAAMGFTFPIMSVLVSLAFGVGIGASSTVSRAIGRGDTQLVKRLSSQAIVMALLVASLFAIVGYHTIDPVFRLLGAPDELLPLIHDYMDIWYRGSFLVVVPMVGNSCIRAAGNTRLPSQIMISVAIMNIILDPIFIFGLFEFPPMGLKGAALATVISYSFACIIGLYILIGRLRFIDMNGLTTDVGKSWRQILHISIPATGTNLIAPASVALTTWMIAGFGSEAVAGFAVASRIESLFLVVIMALASVMAPFSGQNWGAKRPDRLQQAISLSYRFVYIWGLIIAVLLWLFARQITITFNEHPAVVDAATLYLHIVPITYTLLGVVMITASVANGVGSPGPALIMTLLRLAILYLPLAWLFAKLWGYQGVFVASAAANLLVGLGAIIWSRSTCKRLSMAL